jgi:FkbM family methyltransferase
VIGSAEAKDFAFRIAHGFRGAPVLLDGETFRLDEGLRRWDARPEAPMFREMRASLRSGDTVVDVGANFGLHSLFAGRLVGASGHVYSFEPVPANLRLLRRHIRLNDFEQRVEVIPSAVSNSGDASVQFFLPSEDVAVTASLKAEGAARAISVPNCRLDDWAGPAQIAPRLIKIDVEGAELEVLRGALNLLERCHPLLLIEVHGFALPGFGATPDDLIAFLARLGYRERRIDFAEERADYYQSVFHL